MKKLMLLLTGALCCASLMAQGPDTHYFAVSNGLIYWRMEYDASIPQAELAKILEERGVLTQIDASKPGVITAKLPMHPVRYDGAGIRPEHAEILLTAAQVSGDVVVKVGGSNYVARVDHLVLQMARPSTREDISGTHPFEYHFKHPGEYIRNSMFNTYLGAALDFELNQIFLVRDPKDDEKTERDFTPPTPKSYKTEDETLSTTAPGGGRVLLPQGAVAYDLRSGDRLNSRTLSVADGFYGQWKGEMFGGKQHVSFVCFKPGKLQAQIVSAQREAADSTEALGRRYQALAGINGSFFNTEELTPTAFLKDEGVVICADNQAEQATGLVAVDGASVRIVPLGETALDETGVPEPDGIVSGPMILVNGQMQPQQAESPEMRDFLMRRHPRSLIGRDQRGAIWLIVVDGRASGQAEGMTLTETAALCWQFGLSDALNLDGGGSSTLWTERAGVLNHPCDNQQFDAYGQRIVPSAILVQ